MCRLLLSVSFFQHDAFTARTTKLLPPAIRNFDSLSSHFQVMAFDWLGTGLSGRPPANFNGRENTEEFFIESMKKWRKEMGLEGNSMILMGHSLGGYLSACYALKYPEHLQHLILVCPAGIPEAPEQWQSRWQSGASFSRRTLFKAIM
jgi:abhydrolase domain-containing protein 5